MTTTPHWPSYHRPGFDRPAPTSHATGVGAAQDLAALLEANLTPDALNAITPSVKSALDQGYALASDLTPTYNLIDTIASGGTPDPQMAVTALAGAATLVNPVAGAAVMAAGELAIGVQTGLESLLKGLGLISDAIKPVPYVGLIKKGDPIPSGGPGSLHPDPLWQTWPSFARWWWPSGGGTDYGWYPSVGETTIGASPSVAAGVIDGIMHELWATSPNYRSNPGSTRASGLVVTPTPANGFEAFVLPMLEKDIENWANANPYVDPRALVLAAITAWNEKHESGPNDITYQPSETMGQGFIPFLLGSRGDSSGNQQRFGSQTVQMGASKPTSTVRIVHLSSLASLVAKQDAAPAPAVSPVVAGTAIVAGGALLAPAVIALVKGQAVDVVYKSIWSGVKRIFKR